jgi:diguanylate cyclase (GGDEF)-like protein
MMNPYLTPTGTTIMNDSILLVDDDPGTVQLLGHILSGVGNLQFATSGEDALRMARQSAPDLILLDAEMRGMSGFQVLDSLRTDPQLAEVPVIFVTSHSEAGFEVSALEMGAADFISKPFKSSLVLARVKTHLRLKRMSDELRRIASTDSLTGLANRRQFDDTLEREWLRSLRDGDPVGLLLIDVDHFKLYNDRYGHPKGDACLRQLAAALTSASLRPADLVARCGGEEFAILLPQTSRCGAEHVAHRVLGMVEALGIRHEASPMAGHVVTLSIGITCYDDASACWSPPSADYRFGLDPRERGAASDLVLAADKALYSAKHAGRGRAKLLDIADVNTPQLARDIVRSSDRPLRAA